MTNERYELTRRDTLAALGAVGVASAGAGLGTTAYFSDEETFKNNTLTAGALDLKVDWQQTYYGREEQTIPVNAYPDHDGDGWQSIEREQDDGEGTTAVEYEPGSPLTFSCSELESGSDLPEDVYAAPNRSADDGGAIDEQSSLVELRDVKPGDEGEITFSLHLCDNPGYIWLMGELVDASENGVTEPEAADPDEQADVVELLDAIKVEIWYDTDCNNEFADSNGDSEMLILGEGVGPYENPVSLREAFAIMDRNDGLIPLDGDLSTPMSWEEGAEAESRDCFAGETQHCIAVRWWLPIDHANEIQTDSVAFDLGFYTEQCRHNDGSGMTEAINLSTGSADWEVIASPDNTTGPAIVTDPHPAWETTSCASWIDPYGNPETETDPVGEYIYEVEFTVEGSSPVDTLVLDRYGADNPVEFFLDGTSIGGSSGESTFNDLRSDIGSVSNLAPGTHVLRAEVTNNEGSGGNPTGLLVCGQVE